MTESEGIRAEAEDALRRVWFVQSIEEIEHSDISLSSSMTFFNDNQCLCRNRPCPSRRLSDF